MRWRSASAKRVLTVHAIRTGCASRSSACRAPRTRQAWSTRHSGRARDPRLPRRDAAGQRRPTPTAAILTDVLGFREVAREGALARYRGDAPLGALVDLREAGDFPRGRQGRGSVHHIAFRAADDAAQAAMAKKLVADHRMHPTEQKDRNYFRSIYFREPNGILFEIATDQPGFAVDEPASELGHALKLPRFLEPRRAELEAKLPPLHETV